MNINFPFVVSALMKRKSFFLSNTIAAIIMASGDFLSRVLLYTVISAAFSDYLLSTSKIN